LVSFQWIFPPEWIFVLRGWIFVSPQWKKFHFKLFVSFQIICFALVKKITANYFISMNICFSLLNIHFCSVNIHFIVIFVS
jgi:hypothetical protein